MIHYKQGNLLEATGDCIAHGNNCFSNMDAGIALQIAQKWPEVEKADRENPLSPDNRLGTTQIVTVQDPIIKYIFNCYTQFSFGKKVHANYGAIESSMRVEIGQILNQFLQKFLKTATFSFF